MKHIAKIIVLMLVPLWTCAQQHLPDSIKMALKNTANDSIRYRANLQAYFYFEEINRDSALYYNEQTLYLTKKNNKRLLAARSLASKAYQLTATGRYAEALNNLLDALAIAQDSQNATNSWVITPGSTPEKTRLLVLCLVHHMFGVLMDRTQNTEQMIYHFKEAKRIGEKIKNSQRVLLADMNLGYAYFSLNKTDSALMFENEAKDIALKTGQKKYLGYILGSFGEIALKNGDKTKAKQFYYEGIHSAIEQNNVSNLLRNYINLTNLYLAENEKDSSLYFAKKTLETFKTIGPNTSQHINWGIAYGNLYSSYKLRKQLDSAFKYAGLAVVAQDSIYKKRIESLAQFQNLSFKEQLRLQNLEKEKAAYQSRLRFYGAIAALLVVVAIVIILWLANKKQQKANQLLKKQKEVIEEQAHEVKIEAALERVRSRTMAMQRSEELAETAFILFQQFKELGENPDQATIGVINEDEWVIEYWVTMYGSQINKVFKFSIDEPNVTNRIYKAWKGQEKSLIIDLTGKELHDFTAYRASMGGAVRNDTEQRRMINVAFFSRGLINVQSSDTRSAASIRLLERFAGVFDGTYTRFLDLKKAEAQAKEAIKQASVDRVRGQIASMRTTNDLERITPLIWNELTILGIPFIRCGVFIIDEQEQLIYTYLSTADGKALATFNLQFNSESIGQNVLPAWRGKQVATIHWSKEEFATYTKNLVDQGTVKSKERYVTEHPDTSLDLHFLPFLQGMLYVGNIAPLTEDEMSLVQSLADAFSTAYARYEDFNKLEAAKQQVEKTLTQLKATQTKLIQSEKMASLGELTAGIAHEIQNPLNFVNNFSEVSAELIDEMEAELNKGDTEEAIAIAVNIKHNLEKIRHHGKRADGIVKGMLQHSRASVNAKEPTDLNKLADEYLRLSYHGLRAKDKSFNAEIATHFDEHLPKIDLVPQDIGRVMLNLFNNAFYAVHQKQKTTGANYKPEVIVNTSRENGQVIITVKDNGNGIPDSIKDKIMQPFFTTKPTGEGTGLGLSLSYDIVVKGHEGKIEVDSKEGEFTTFSIQLPILNQ